MEVHHAYSNAGYLCSWCGWIMDGSKSDHSKEPFDFILICVNATCPHAGVRYLLRREQGIKLEKLEATCPVTI
jgi:rubredoxin